MKIDGNKFMKWLHKIREEEGREAKRIGIENKRKRDLEIAREVLKRYRIPIVKI